MFNLASSYIELEGFKLGSNSATSRTRRHPTAVVLTDKYIDTLLTKAADAFGTCITIAQYGKFPTCSAVYLHREKRARRRIR